jgi:hypothetical protein
MNYGLSHCPDRSLLSSQWKSPFRQRLLARFRRLRVQAPNCLRHHSQGGGSAYSHESLCQSAVLVPTPSWGGCQTLRTRQSIRAYLGTVEAGDHNARSSCDPPLGVGFDPAGTVAKPARSVAVCGELRRRRAVSRWSAALHGEGGQTSHESTPGLLPGPSPL